MVFASAPLSPARANLLLLLAALFWGLGGVPQKTVLEHLDPLTAAGLRGTLGAALLMPFALCGPRMVLRDLGGLARVALWFALALTLQQAAYRDATVTNATFLVAAGVILTPSLVWLLHGERPEPGLTTRASLTVLGLALMIGGSGAVAKGDLLALASAAAYAMRAIALVRHLRAGGSVMMAITAQFAVAGVLALPAGLWLGAQGIHCGTVFLATRESYPHDYHKRRLVEAGAEDTVYTDVYVLNWPKGAAVRVLRNSVVAGLGHHLTGHDPNGFPRDMAATEEGRPLLRYGMDSPLRPTEGDLETMALYAGQGTAFVEDIPSAAEVVARLMSEAETALKPLAKLGGLAEQRQ